MNTSKTDSREQANALARTDHQGKGKSTALGSIVELYPGFPKFLRRYRCLHSAILLLEDCSDICGLAIATVILERYTGKVEVLKEVIEGKSFASRAGTKLNFVESKRNELHIV